MFATIFFLWVSHLFVTLPVPISCRIHNSPLLVFLLVLAAGFWLFQLLRSVCNLFSYWDIQVFYREALHIPPVSLRGQHGQRTGESGGHAHGRTNREEQKDGG